MDDIFSQQNSQPDVADKSPLVVDLDGTLIRTDLLTETMIDAAARRPLTAVRAMASLRRGRQPLKAVLAEEADIDPATLPYDESVLSLIQAEADAGRPVYLASGSDERLVEAVAKHLGFFSGWFGSKDGVNLTGRRKAAKLVAEFGERGFAYIGDSRVDLDVWKHADEAISVNASSGVRASLDALRPGSDHIQRAAPSLRVWLKQLRIHQYSKNALIFVPVLTGHAFDAASLLAACLAFVAFSMAASATYLVNDLVDLTADRAHPTKRERPLASGAIPILHAAFMAPLLLAAAFGVAAIVSPIFMLALLGYLVTTTAYSFYLKRRLMIDVVTLAGLYTTRVIGGAVATGVGTSEWLLGFSMFIFLCLAIVKRYTEMAMREEAGLPDPTNRNYRIADLPMLGSMASASGLSAVVMFGLYLSSDTVAEAYSRPQALWMVCPLLMYWIGRVLLLAQRREMHDDPIVFALRDRISLLALIAISILVLAAI